MHFIENPSPADELKWLINQQVRLSQRLGSTPPLDIVPLGGQARLRLDQAYRHLQVREAALLAALGGSERCRETSATLHTWPRIDSL